MKYLKQVMIILLFSLLGETLKYVLPLPIPSSIYGMILLFVSLMTGIIKLDQVENVGKLLIEIMPIMFIPAGVKIIASWGVLEPMIVPVSVITVVVLIVVMIATGRVSQAIIRLDSKKEGEDKNE